MFFLKLLFREEGHLYGQCLFYIPTIYPKCLLFQFFSRGIRMHIPILTGVQNGHISRLKDSVFLVKKCSFWSFFNLMKITCMPIAYFIFWLFILNAILFSSLVVAYVCTFPSFLLKNVLFETSFTWWSSLVCLFNILTIYSKCRCFHFVSRGIGMYIPILTGVQNGHISCLKDSVSLQKKILFEASFLCGRSLVCQLLVLYSDYLS